MTSAPPEQESYVVARAMPAIISAPPKRNAMMRTLRRHPTMWLGGTLLALVAIMAIFAPIISTSDPSAMNPAVRVQPPSAEAWFGTDMLGRDIFARSVYGARVSLIVGIGVALFATIVGMIIGLTAGFVRWADGIIMRIMDGMMSIPAILLAIALMTLMRGGSVMNVILAITIAEIPRVARLTRSAVLSVRELTYVEAAVACGTSKLGIIRLHILPNTVAPITVQATYICASAMITEAILSFIGAGLPTSIPSWGNIMAEGRALWQVKPNIVFFPAIFLSVTVLAVNLLGDGLRDAVDPRLAKRV
ncbi:ABC transporter permease [Octadecabacter sp. G9-8]|uniref:ABC transporter permease n=1 Tax=Octadecabacter dasysiphoniae TaxID=2909341 RepID=A0ABS9CUA3_9RHOB|nr:ABC transporter permease [Octadecabacter dasysiphoniae]MCF2870414.1 ABC transporter permease [Octadecabacter dasysiphoniae]